jgi:hypothetical protein
MVVLSGCLLKLTFDVHFSSGYSDFSSFIKPWLKVLLYEQGRLSESYFYARTTFAALFSFFFLYFIFLIVVLGVHCDIYKILYNIS